MFFACYQPQLDSPGAQGQGNAKAMHALNRPKGHLLTQKQVAYNCLAVILRAWPGDALQRSSEYIRGKHLLSSLTLGECPGN